MESDEDEVLLSGTRKRRFDQQQIASLTAYYNTGMKGEGEQYSSKINHAAAETGFSDSYTSKGIFALIA